MYFASSSFAPMHMMNNSKGRKKRFEQNGQPTSCTDSGHGTCTETSFYTETETSLLHVHFSLTGSMIVLVGWHNLEYIRNMQIHYFTHRVHVVFPRISLLGAPAIAHGGNYICKCHMGLIERLWLEIFASIWWHIMLLRHFLSRAPLLLCNITHFYHQEMNIT